MFLNGLKAKSIIRKIEKATSERVYVPMGKKPVHVGLIQNQAYPFSVSKLQKLADTLDVRRDDITILNFVSALAKEDKGNPALLSLQQIGWNGVFKAKHLKEFSQMPFDILFNYYEKEELPLITVTALSKATFKVGISQTLEKMNDLTIHVKEGKEDLFISELEKYLKILKIIK